MFSTSYRAYLKIKEDGTLPLRRLQALEAFAHTKQPCTANEMMTTAKKLHKEYNAELVFSLEKRIKELVRQEVLDEVGERECLITGNVCTIYKMTYKEPKKLSRKMSNKEKLKIASEALESIAGNPYLITPHLIAREALDQINANHNHKEPN